MWWLLKKFGCFICWTWSLILCGSWWWWNWFEYVILWLLADAFHLGEETDGDELRPEYLCPFCAEDFDIVGLCCHIDEEHTIHAKNGVLSSFYHYILSCSKSWKLGLKRRVWGARWSGKSLRALKWCLLYICVRVCQKSTRCAPRSSGSSQHTFVVLLRKLHLHS